MNVLFVHRRFPGQFAMVAHALARAGHRVVFVTEAPAPAQGIADVHRVEYRVAPASDRTHGDAREFDAAMRRAQAVAEVAAGLRAAGFAPDVVVGHDAWGETLNLAEVWPGARLLDYREYFYHLAGADVGFDPEFPFDPAGTAALRARNAVALLSLNRPSAGVAPTAWQRGLYPAWSRARIEVVPDGVDLALCRPDPAARMRAFRLGELAIAPGRRVVTFVARDLEPYRGFHVFMRAVPRLLARGDVEVVCVGGDGVSYGLPPPSGTWRGRMLAELGDAIDPARVHFPGQVAYADHVRVLQRSDVHVYLSYPFVVSWSLREALACGCAVVAGDTDPVREFVEDGRTGVLAPGLDPDGVAARVLGLLEDAGARAALGRGARAFAEAALPMGLHLARWGRLLDRVAG